MKKIALLLTLCLSFSCLASPVSAFEADSLQPGLNILIDGTTLSTEIVPFIENDRTLAPAEPLAAALGAEVAYEEGALLLIKNHLVFRLEPDSNIIVGESVNYTLDVAPKKVNDVFFVPVRFLAEMLGYQVNFEQATKGGQVYASVVLANKITTPAVSIVFPGKDNLAELLQIASVTSQTNATLLAYSTQIYYDYAQIYLASGQPAIIYDDGKVNVNGLLTGDPSLQDLTPYLKETALATLALIEADEVVKAAVTRDDGAITAFPVKNGENIDLFFIPGSIDTVAAVAYLNAYSSIVSSFSAQ